jgi:hypothetical protein
LITIDRNSHNNQGLQRSGMTARKIGNEDMKIRERVPVAGKGVGRRPVRRIVLRDG